MSGSFYMATGPEISIPSYMIPLKSRNHFNFQLQTNVAFFLNQSFLSIHLNKVSHYITWLIYSP